MPKMPIISIIYFRDQNSRVKDSRLRNSTAQVKSQEKNDRKAKDCRILPRKTMLMMSVMMIILLKTEAPNTS